MTKKFFRAALALSLASSFVSCGGINAPRPEFKAPPPVVERETERSEFEIPFAVNLKPLSEKAESAIPKELASNDWETLASSRVGDMGVRYKFWREPLAINIHGNTVSITIHSRYWMTAGHRIKGGLIPGLSLPWTAFGSCGKGDEQPREIVFTLETTLSWGDDWRIIPKTRILPNIYPVRCKISSFDLDVTKPIDEEIARRLSVVAQIADKYLAERLDFRATARDVWAKANKPMEMDDGLWLTLNPEGIHVTPVSGDGKNLETRIALTARPVVSAGKPRATSEKPFPSFAVDVPGAGLFSVAVKGEFSFESAGKELTRKYSNNPVKYEGKNVNVDEVRMYPSGGLCVLQVRVSGSVSGTIYFTGRPVYDGETLLLEDFDYTVETMNVLQAANEWLLHADFRQKLARQARFGVGLATEDSRVKLEKSLNRRINDHIALEAKINGLRVLDVYMATEGFKTVVVADGSARLTWE